MATFRVTQIPRQVQSTLLNYSAHFGAYKSSEAKEPIGWFAWFASFFVSSKPKGDSRFVAINNTDEKEAAYDLIQHRALERPTGFIGTVAYMVKGALGAGILGSHCGYAASGTIAIPMTCAVGVYMCFTLHLLVKTAQIVYKRTGICQNLSYSDVGEAAFAISEFKCIRRLSKPFRYFIDFVICLDLFGACCCYQLMIAGTLKQAVENQQMTSAAALRPGYPNLRMYMLMLSVLMIVICLIKHLDLLAKLSVIGNFLVFLCILTTVYYSLKVNPNMEGTQFFKGVKGTFIFLGQTVFSMSCSGIVIATECNMSQPTKFPLALAIGMFFITVSIAIVGFFGYSAYGELSKAPVTFHFPLTVLPMMLKIGIAVMLVITHAVNFWVPFHLLFRYLQKLHREERRECVEYIYRAICCFLCTCIGIVFPNVNKIMGFLGAFCLSNMAFIFPVVIWLTVHLRRPGLGQCYYRVWLAIFLIAIGMVLFAAGSYVNGRALLELFGANDAKIDENDFPLEDD